MVGKVVWMGFEIISLFEGYFLMTVKWEHNCEELVFISGQKLAQMVKVSFIEERAMSARA